MVGIKVCDSGWCWTSLLCWWCGVFVSGRPIVVVLWFILIGLILVNLLGCGSVWVGEIGLRQVGVGLTSVVRRLTKGGRGAWGWGCLSFYDCVWHP